MSAVVLVIIIYIIIGLLHDFLFQSTISTNKEGLPMKTKFKNFFTTCFKSIISSAWTMYANLSSGALLA